MARSARKDTHDSCPRNLGRYRLYGELASGGMATVHLGRQIGSGGFSKMVAIKRLHPQFGKLDEFVEMFLTEARLAARIRHPNVVQPLDVLRVEDEVFLVMEYVEGDSLSRLMKATVARQEKVPLPIAVGILSGVLRGLHAAHEAKNDKGEALEIVHRDVSPQNVLVGVDGTPRVIDFGIAKAANSVQVTREGELKGKLAYIAPEVLSGHRGTRRTDIYAAAVVLWEVLTAQRLFDADYQSAVLASILHRPVDPPSDFIAGLPPALDRVVMKGLARDPSDRYATAREMATALEEASPAASPAVIGEWVESVAALSLGGRSKRVAQIEALSSEEDTEEEAEEVLSEFMSVSQAEPSAPPPAPRSRTLSQSYGARSGAPVAPPPPPPSRARVPVLTDDSRVSAPPPPPRSRIPSETDEARNSAPPPPPRSRIPSRTDEDRVGPIPAPASMRPARTTLASQPAPSQRPVDPPVAPPPNIVIDEGASSAPAWPVQGIAPAPMGSTVVIGPRHRSSGGGIVVFMLLTALVVAGIYVGLPEFLKRSYTEAAAHEGVTLTIDSVEVALRRVRVVGVTATMADLPGFTLHAQSVEVWFSLQLSPTDATLHDALLTVDGSGSAVADALRRMRLAHDFKALRQGTLRQVSVDAGHLVWARAFGEGTRLEAENIAMQAERSGHDPLGEDLTLASPIVVVTTPWAKLGPWVGNAQVDHGQAKATVMLDPSGASRAAATFVVDHGTVTTFDLALPRSNVGLLGVGSDRLGRRQEDSTFAEGEAHYAVRSASRIEASVKLNLSGARLANALGGTDAQLEAHLDGDPARPIEVTRGTFAFGPFRGAVSGPVTIGDAYLRVDVGLHSGAAHCPSGADASLGGGVVFDTRSVGDARLVVAPSARCGLRMLPP